MKFIIICATGRSGSTTLQRIINTIPNSNICGENIGAISHLLEFYKTAKRLSKERPSGELNIGYEHIIKRKIKPAWYNSFDLNTIKNKLKELIISFFDNRKNNKILGCKSVSFTNRMELLDIFIELFPNTRILCHIRLNVNEQCNSTEKSMCKLKKKDISGIMKYNKNIIEYYNKHKDYCYLSIFENMFQVQEIKKLFNFLGETFNENKWNTIINDY